MSDGSDNIPAMMQALGEAARDAAAVLARTTTETKNAALRAAAVAIRADVDGLIEANAKDLDVARGRGMSEALLDRLALDADRVEGIAAGLEAVAELPDPVGLKIDEWERPNGLRIGRVRVPLGVIGIIYESRPNVTADAGCLCLKSGNAAILRGGSESFHSSHAIHAALVHGLKEAGLPEACIQLVPTRDRAAVGEMLTMTDYIDVVVPRGGKSLVARVAEESRVPVLKHLDGICHVYVDGAAEADMAESICLNAKLRRTSICGAAETVLVDKAAAEILSRLVKSFLDAGCEVRGDAETRAVDDRVIVANSDDWDAEYLDAIIAIKTVDGVDAAIDHIDAHGSHHTDSIVTEDEAAAERFLDRVDSGIVLHNASTQFADGGEFGMGAEIGISTGKLHARGPVGLEQLTSYKYVVHGSGQTRP
ncbi:MAG: glutamate-5-semialdehyde dehydrogenase [Alphaproteobacteria bacterium]|jgi:glutamate-5-semialdehyde dehydrogenase|nr:glutamate-5-semialdehyde dehydrogenase [Alphaproteobacteria bacterium]